MFDLEDVVELLVAAAHEVADIYRSFSFQILGNEYNGFVVIVAFLIFFYLVDWIWGGDEE